MSWRHHQARRGPLLTPSGIAAVFLAIGVLACAAACFAPFSGH